MPITWIGFQKIFAVSKIFIRKKNKPGAILPIVVLISVVCMGLNNAFKKAFQQKSSPLSLSCPSINEVATSENMKKFCNLQGQPDTWKIDTLMPFH